jgi:NAD(P)-dependent dehydrogenase (short-subunit alcohol dehydrogenase family)
MAERPLALVTGSVRRIGRAIVEDLSRHGFDVALHCHGSREEADVIAAELSHSGARVQVFGGDLTVAGASAALIGDVTAAMEPLRLLVNNASIFEDDEMGALSEAQFDLHFAIHVKAPVFLSEAFAAQLPAGADGLIVNIIDQRVWRPNPKFFSYTLSKAALWSATRTMAQALAPRIRVNAIGPGPTLKNIRQTDEDFKKSTEGLLLQHGPDLSEFGATVRYLWAAKSVTGQMIALDGGQHLAWETPDILGIAE